MSHPRFLDPANSPDELQAQLQEQEKKFRMEVLGVGIDQTNETPPQKSNFAEINPNFNADQLAAIQVKLVPAAIAADPTQFRIFFTPLIADNTIVDSSIVLIAGIEQQVIVFRPGSPVPFSGIPQSASGLAPQLPDYAQNILSAAQGVPWGKCETLPAMNGYTDLMPDRFRFFRKLQGPNGSQLSALYYECKLAIDNDGSGGNAGGDPDHQDDTSLHDGQDNALNANRDSFAVFPLDGSEAAALHNRHPKVELKRAGLPDFRRDLGLRIGDLGVSFWRKSGQAAVKPVFFIYGDNGPPNNVGEGSVNMANLLSIDSRPVGGGIDAGQMKALGKGIIHIGFPGSGTAFLKSSTVTKLVPGQIETQAAEFFKAFLNQSA